MEYRSAPRLRGSKREKDSMWRIVLKSQPAGAAAIRNAPSQRRFCSGHIAAPTGCGIEARHRDLPPVSGPAVMRIRVG